MKSRTNNLTPAFCISLVVHGLGLSALAWWVVLSTPPPKLAAIDRQKVLLEQLAHEIEVPPKPRPIIVPPPKPQKKPAPPPPEKFEKPLDTFKDDSGEHDGAGTANRSEHGDQPMQAQKALEQAALMKKDAQKFNDASDAPASAGVHDDSNANPQKNARPGQVVPDFNANTTAKDDPSKESAVAMATDKGPIPIPVPKIDSSKPNDPLPSGERNPLDKTDIAQPTNPKTDLKEVRGKKLEASDTESSPFARAPSLMFVAGHLEGRKGLKVQTKEPRYHDSSEVDMESLGDPRTLLGVKVDADGNVLDVQILESSGSTNIDMDRKRAVWDWILEPEKDKDGRVTDDHWTIAMR
jgi:hypothetical protein